MKHSTPLAYTFCLGLGMTLAAPVWAETKLTINSWVPSTHAQYADVMKPWADAINAASEGRLNIGFTDSSLGAPPRQFDLAVDGITDITFGVLGYTPGRFKLAGVAELPFVGETGEELSVALWRTHEKFFADAGEYDDVILLALHASPTGHIFSTKALGPVQSIDQYQGRKMRVGGGLVQEVNLALGGVNVAVPANETFETLSQGIADGTLLPYEAYQGFALSGVITDSTAIPGGFYSSAWFVVMNRDSFEALSPEDQQVILDHSGESLARLAGRAADKADLSARTLMERDGVKFHAAPETLVNDVQSRLHSLEQAWISSATPFNVDGAAALAFMRENVQLVRKTPTP